MCLYVAFGVIIVGTKFRLFIVISSKVIFRNVVKIVTSVTLLCDIFIFRVCPGKVGRFFEHANSYAIKSLN